MTEVTVALDWTPNTNHAGLYAAAAEGRFAEAGLDVRFRSPAVDGYERTPADLVERGEATVGVAPSESPVSYATHPGKDRVVSVATLLQHDLSAIAARADSGIERPRDLDGRTYASYGARFEDDIVAQLVRNDGGEGAFESVEPPKLDNPEELLSGEADATWVFVPWEGLQAERAGVALVTFPLEEYGVPYGYTPTLVAHPETLREEGDVVRAFLRAAAAGHRDAAADPEWAARTLARTAEGPGLDDEAFLAESQRLVAAEYLDDDGRWGWMERDRWAAFVDWLSDVGALTDLQGDHLPADEVDVDALFTVEYLPA
jgi:NitT/TauT family transport system substrate-binding protein